MRHLRKFNSRVFESVDFTDQAKTPEAKALAEALEDEGVKSELAKMSTTQLGEAQLACGEIVVGAATGEFEKLMTESYRRSKRGYNRINEGRDEVQKLANKFQAYGLIGTVAGGFAAAVGLIAFGEYEVKTQTGANLGSEYMGMKEFSGSAALPGLVIVGAGLISTAIGVYLQMKIDSGTYND